MLKTQLPDKEKWGRQLKLLIKGSGVTQGEIARRINISDPTITKIIAGKGTHDQLAQVEQALIEIVEGE